MATQSEIIRAAKGPHEGLYFIGPYGRRVNFAAQQRRTLNLVGALAEDLKGSPTVAVVGGGVGGVMAAAALAARDCTVWLYEASNEVLSLQFQTGHRYIHPTLGFWPEDNISLTTRLPFFDWFASLCSDTIALLRDEWDDNIQPLLPAARTGQRITSVKPHPKGGFTLRIKGERSPERVDLVFVVTGFGEERTLGQPRYWKADELETKRNEAPNQKFVVSGTSDGGSIDFLRLVHDDFDYGRLCERLVNLIDQDGKRAHVRKIEEEATRLFRRGKLNKLSEMYSEKYTRFLNHLPDGAVKLLDDSLSYKNWVSFYGRYNAPFEYFSAPVHKIMVAHAFRHNGQKPESERRFEFRQGSVQKGRGGHTFMPNGGTEERIRANYVVVRHGPELNIATFTKDTPDFAEKLKKNQQSIADYEDGDCDASAFQLAGYPTRDIQSMKFADKRLDIASRFLLPRGKLVDLAVNSEGTPTFFYYEETNLRARQPSAELPDELFGINLKHRAGGPKRVKSSHKRRS